MAVLLDVEAVAFAAERSESVRYGRSLGPAPYGVVHVEHRSATLPRRAARPVLIPNDAPVGRAQVAARQSDPLLVATSRGGRAAVGPHRCAAPACNRVLILVRQARGARAERQEGATVLCAHGVRLTERLGTGPRRKRSAVRHVCALMAARCTVYIYGVRPIGRRTGFPTESRRCDRRGTGRH